MVGKYEVEIYEDGDGSFYYIDPDSGEEVTCDEDGNSGPIPVVVLPLSIPPIPKQVQFVGAPEEWKELEKIDKDAEVKDYQENGIWDIAGLRDDLKLMREKLGEKVKPSGKNDEKESEVGAILSPGNNDSIKKSDNSSVKSKLEVLRELKALLDEKIIDDEEFKKMKKEIIN